MTLDSIRNSCDVLVVMYDQTCQLFSIITQQEQSRIRRWYESCDAEIFLPGLRIWFNPVSTLFAPLMYRTLFMTLQYWNQQIFQFENKHRTNCIISESLAFYILYLCLHPSFVSFLARRTATEFVNFYLSYKVKIKVHSVKLEQLKVLERQFKMFLFSLPLFLRLIDELKCSHFL